MKKIYIKKSKIAGKGLFAKQDIQKNEPLFRVRGRKIKSTYGQDENQSLENYFSTGPNWLSIAKNAWISPYSNCPWRYINHSCQPNAGLKNKTTVVAMRNIKPNEEIMIDYSITEDDPDWQMPCSCGSKNCRKIIKSIRFLPKSLFKKYEEFTPLFLKTSYRRANRAH